MYDQKNNESDASFFDRNIVVINSWAKDASAKSYPLVSRLFMFFSKYLLLPALVIVSSVGVLYKSVPKAYAQSGELQFSVVGSNDGFTLWGGTGANTSDVVFNYRPENNQYVCSVSLWLRKSNSPTDNIYVSLYTKGDSSLTTASFGALLNTSDEISGASLTTSDTYQTFTFDNCQLLTGSAYYSFLVARDGTYGDTNKYGMAYTTGTPSATVIRTLVNASGWVLQTNTRLFDLYGIASLEIVDIPATSTLLTGLYTGLSSNLQDCSAYNGGLFSSSTLQALGCFANNTAITLIDVFFIPSPSSTGVGVFRNSLTAFTTVFPFNIFFNFASIVNDSADGYEVEDNTISWTVPMSIGSKTFSFNSSTLTSAGVSTSTWATVREWESNLIWLFAAFGIIATIVL